MNKLQLIDADTLYYKLIAHPKMLIDGVLSDGLAILAGDSKIGKSWMVLWLCLQISRGEAVWGLPTRKTDVVYLALEDREWRVQQRMQELTDSPPENLRFLRAAGRRAGGTDRGCSTGFSLHGTDIHRYPPNGAGQYFRKGQCLRPGLQGPVRPEKARR